MHQLGLVVINIDLICSACHG